MAIEAAPSQVRSPSDSDTSRNTWFMVSATEWAAFVSIAAEWPISPAAALAMAMARLAARAARTVLRLSLCTRPSPQRAGDPPGPGSEGPFPAPPSGSRRRNRPPRTPLISPGSAAVQGLAVIPSSSDTALSTTAKAPSLSRSTGVRARLRAGSRLAETTANPAARPSNAISAASPRPDPEASRTPRAARTSAPPSAPAVRAVRSFVPAAISPPVPSGFLSIPPGRDGSLLARGKGDGNGAGARRRDRDHGPCPAGRGRGQGLRRRPGQDRGGPGSRRAGARRLRHRPQGAHRRGGVPGPDRPAQPSGLQLPAAVGAAGPPGAVRQPRAVAPPARLHHRRADAHPGADPGGQQGGAQVRRDQGGGRRGHRDPGVGQDEPPVRGLAGPQRRVRDLRQRPAQRLPVGAHARQGRLPH